MGLCNFCGADADLKCGGCSARFCNEACQRRSWKSGHKQSCKAVAPEVAASMKSMPDVNDYHVMKREAEMHSGIKWDTGILPRIVKPSIFFREVEGECILCSGRATPTQKLVQLAWEEDMLKAVHRVVEHANVPGRSCPRKISKQKRSSQPFFKAMADLLKAGADPCQDVWIFEPQDRAVGEAAAAAFEAGFSWEGWAAVEGLSDDSRKPEGFLCSALAIAISGEHGADGELLRLIKTHAKARIKPRALSRRPRGIYSYFVDAINAIDPAAAVATLLSLGADPNDILDLDRPSASETCKAWDYGAHCGKSCECNRLCITPFLTRVGQWWWYWMKGDAMKLPRPPRAHDEDVSEHLTQRCLDQIISKLVKAGADINAVNWRGLTPLVYLIQEIVSMVPDEEEGEEEEEEEGSEYAKEMNAKGLLPLATQVAAVRRLLEAGADPNLPAAAPSFAHRPLDSLAQMRSSPPGSPGARRLRELLACLLEHGASFQPIPHELACSHDKAQHQDQGGDDAATSCRDFKADDCLRRAVDSHNKVLLEFAVREAGVPVDTFISSIRKGAVMSDRGLVSMAVSLDEFLPAAGGGTMLLHAVSEGQIVPMLTLLELGADPRKEDPGRAVSPLALAELLVESKGREEERQVRKEDKEKEDGAMAGEKQGQAEGSEEKDTSKFAVTTTAADGTTTIHHFSRAYTPSDLPTLMRMAEVLRMQVERLEGRARHCMNDMRRVMEAPGGPWPCTCAEEEGRGEGR